MEGAEQSQQPPPFPFPRPDDSPCLHPSGSPKWQPGSQGGFLLATRSYLKGLPGVTLGHISHFKAIFKATFFLRSELGNAIIKGNTTEWYSKFQPTT